MKNHHHDNNKVYISIVLKERCNL